MPYGVAFMSPGNAWAVGAINTGANDFAGDPYLAHWDGRAWTQVASSALPKHGFINAITSFKGGAWAVGASGTHPPGTDGHHKPLILRLAHGTWTRVPYPTKGTGHYDAVAASSPSNAWVVGYSLDDSGDPAGHTLLVHWNGRAWKQVKYPALPANGWLTGVATTSPDNAWAVGDTGQPGAIFILHWNGMRWRLMHLPGLRATSLFVYDVTATSATNAWVVGMDSGKTKTTTLILHWNGRTWRRVPSPNPGGGPNTGTNLGPYNALFAVAASSAASAWAVGMGSTRGVEFAPLILRWNGHAWKHVAAPDPPDGAALQGVGIGPSGHAWAVGSTDGSVIQPVYEYWNGTAWH